MNAHTAMPYQSAPHRTGPHRTGADGKQEKESITMSGYVSTDDQIMAMNDLAAAMEMVATLAEGENYRNEADISAPQIAPLLRVFAGFTRSYCTHLPYAHGIVAKFDA